MYEHRQCYFLLIVDHLLCLNREGANTGPEWFETTIAAVAKQVREAQSKDEPVDLPVNLWWGMKDAMVPAGGRGVPFGIARVID